jgi:hypothetical protein
MHIQHNMKTIKINIFHSKYGFVLHILLFQRILRYFLLRLYNELILDAIVICFYDNTINITFQCMTNTEQQFCNVLRLFMFGL